MKSSLSYAILHGNARSGVRSLYVSLEQPRESLGEQMAGLGLSPAAVGDAVSVLDLSALREKLPGTGDRGWLDVFQMYTASIRQSFAYDLLVIDSLESLAILARFRNPRRDLFQLFRWLRGLGATCLLIGERPPESGGATTGAPAEYLADGLLYLYPEKRGEFEVQRRLRVVKMRGLRHATSVQALVFDEALRVTPIVG
jgi:KaiC/GvpD/RAD55 family RecA-like ATPase